MIKAKKNHINLLKQEIALVRIEDQLKVKKTQDAIEKFKNKIIGEVCSNIPCNVQVFFRGKLGNY